MAHIEADQILTLAHTTAEALPTLAEPSAEVLERAQSFIELIQQPDVIQALLTLERHRMNTIDLPLASGKKDDEPTSEENLLLRVSRPVIDYPNARCKLIATRTEYLNGYEEVPGSIPLHDDTSTKISDQVRQWIRRQYQYSKYQVEGIYDTKVSRIRIALVRSLGSAESLARSHGSRIDPMFEKLHEYIVQASTAGAEASSAAAPADE